MDAEQFLHGSGSESDLVSDDAIAASRAHLDVRALNAVRIRESQLRKARRQRLDWPPLLFRLRQFRGTGRDHIHFGSGFAHIQRIGGYLRRLRPVVLKPCRAASTTMRAPLDSMRPSKLTH